MSQNKSLGHIMIDLETLDTEPTAVITAIAAVEFDLKTGQTGRVFYKRIDIQSCLELGRTISADTLKWWFEQSKEAQMELFREPENIAIVLFEFKNWLNQFNEPVNEDYPKIWGNGIGFDLEILKNAFNSRFMRISPWRYYDERDVQTHVSLNPELKENTPFEGLAHNALSDCLHQIKYCSKIYNSINLKKVV